MTFGTAELLAHVAKNSGGYARQHHFTFECAKPKGLRIEEANLKRVMMNCFSSVVPGRQLATKESDQGGVIQRQIPHSVIYSELPLNFYVSDDLAEKRFFDAWHDLVIEPSWGNLSYYDDYVVTSTLTKKSRSTKVSTERDNVMKYELLECYPKVVGDIQLTYEGRDQVCTMPVQMVYYMYKNDQSIARDLVKKS
jgi:hypothetical protein